VLLIVAAFALFLVPVAAIAAGGFTDVDDDSVFLADIQWMKDTGVTKGCNPPTNDRFCPEGNVTREQMSAFMHRLAVNKVVDAATAVKAEHATTADSATSAVTADTAVEADNADTLDGKDSSAFVEHGDIVMATDGHNWTAWGTLSGPSTVDNWMGYTRASSDGDLGIGLSAPTSVGGIEYGLKSVEICIALSSGGFISGTDIYGSTAVPSVPNLASDGTDRTANGCYTVTVNKPAPYGAGIGITLAGGAGGQVEVHGVRSTWTPVADLSVSAGVTDSSGGHNNG